MRFLRRPSAWLLVLLVLTVSPAPAMKGCPFCIGQGQTLTMEVNQAQMVLFGTLANSRLTPGGDGFDSGFTDLIIEEVVKPHAFVKDKKTVVLPRYIPVDKESKVKFLVFCDFFKDRLDPYRGMPVKNKEVVDYLKGAAGLKEKDAATRLEFFFNYLDHSDVEVSSDSYKEFANADNKDVVMMLAKMDRSKAAARLTKWLRDSETPTYRYGLYGYLLGMCGMPKDADVLLELLNDPQRGLISGIDGVLAGYVALKPKEGWQYVLDILKDSSKDFTRRYAALRTVRFFWDNPIKEIPKKDLLAAITMLLDQNDMADLAIEDLRKWKQWDMTGRVLALDSKPNFDVPIIHRSILRFALSCPPEIKEAAVFVEEQRRRYPEKVKDAEELLKLETPLPTASEAATSTTR